MPQMMPMNWLFLVVFFTTIISLMMIFMFFFHFLNSPSSFKLNISPNKNVNYPW